ncbi:hypothetical protein [Eubacterium sp. An11]|uniref:hypothetical protein n=1 Tax=Eubacterium sp. An11 TaxID=1965542 RepID=UPI0013A65D70|nr:hypothetical protein [Eubacterium sp. An11]
MAIYHIYEKNLEIVNYCCNTINSTIEKMIVKTTRWEQDLFSDFVEETMSDGRKVKKVLVTAENQPSYELRVEGEKVDS